MTPAVASLLALIAAIVLSMFTGINVGFVALALAWLIGTYMAGLSPDVIMRGFPTSLFLMVAGISLLFAMAESNGTLGRLARRATRLARGDARVLPGAFFVSACLVSAAGPGSLSLTFVAPVAMAIAARAGVPFLLTALMVTTGANAGNLSPISAVGVIANVGMTKAGLPGHEGLVFFANFLASALVAVAAYLLLRGYRLKGTAALDEVEPPLDGKQRATAVVIAAWIAAVLLLKVNPGLSAFAATIILVVLRAGDDRAATKLVPWGVLLMVSGVSVLVALLENTGGMALFTSLLATLATPFTVNGMMALVTGAISFYSSTSGVVLPAFLPTVPGVVREVGGGDPLAVALSVNVGSSLVDVSPLSTLGALCVAAVPDQESATRLFRALMLWGVSMIVVGAVVAQLLAGVLARF